MVTLSPVEARRLAIVKQRLAGEQPAATPDGIMDVVRELGGLQLDPTSAVARSHWLVLWSRLGPFDVGHLDTLLWQERRLFEYGAYLRPTEDYPFHRWRMRHFAGGNGAWEKRVWRWLTENQSFRAYILNELRQRGPLGSKDIEDRSVTGWKSGGWMSGRNVGQMLELMTDIGEVMISGRKGGQRLWDLPERCLPDWAPGQELSDEEAVRLGVQKSIRARGIAQPKQLQPVYRPALTELAAAGLLIPARIVDDGREWPGPWYIHQDDLPLLERLAAGEWRPRTTLLSPFDTLINDRERTEQLFNFYFRLEIYVPKEKRQYGYFVLPILHGDRLIGRIDPLMDRKRGVLTINGVYAEPDARLDGETAGAVAGAIAELATFLQAKEIVYSGQVPAGWREELR